ncbi:hypothetical protein GCM10010174_66790 [Kutzneria viridogrisea]
MHGLIGFVKIYQAGERPSWHRSNRCTGTTVTPTIPSLSPTLTTSAPCWPVCGEVPGQGPVPLEVSVVEDWDHLLIVGVPGEAGVLMWSRPEQDSTPDGPCHC